MARAEKEKITSYINVYDFHFFVYDLTGFSYIDHEVAWVKLAHAIFHHILCTIVIFNNVMTVYTSYQAFTDSDDLLFVLTITLTTMGITMKICTMEFYKKKVLRLHADLNESLKLSELVGEEASREERIKTEKEFAFITKAFYALLPGSFTIYIVLPALFTDEKALPYVFPIKNLTTPFYEIVYLVEGTITVFLIINTLSYDMICYGLLLRFATNYRIICRAVRKFNDAYPRVDFSKIVPGCSDSRTEGGTPSGGEDTEFLKGLRELKSYEETGSYDRDLTTKTVGLLSQAVRHHQELRCQVTLMDQIFSLNMIVQVVVGTGVFCMAAAILFSEHSNILKDIRLSGFAVAGFIDLYLYCYCGSCCIQSEEDFRFELYSLPWYAMDPKVRRFLVFMLMRLQRVKAITVGRISKVDLDLFLKILKFSHSFITLLSEA